MVKFKGIKLRGPLHCKLTDPEARICRWCDRREGERGTHIVTPCRCLGFGLFTCVDCLEEWLTNEGILYKKNDGSIWTWKRCSDCRVIIQLPAVVVPLKKWNYDLYNNDEDSYFDSDNNNHDSGNNDHDSDNNDHGSDNNDHGSDNNDHGSDNNDHGVEDGSGNNDHGSEDGSDNNDHGSVDGLDDDSNDASDNHDNDLENTSNELNEWDLPRPLRFAFPEATRQKLVLKMKEKPFGGDEEKVMNNLRVLLLQVLLFVVFVKGFFLGRKRRKRRKQYIETYWYGFDVIKVALLFILGRIFWYPGKLLDMLFLLKCVYLTERIRNLGITYRKKKNVQVFIP